jgi:hypothetical protein
MWPELNFSRSNQTPSNCRPALQAAGVRTLLPAHYYYLRSVGVECPAQLQAQESVSYSTENTAAILKLVVCSHFPVNKQKIEVRKSQHLECTKQIGGVVEKKKVIFGKTKD